MVYKNVIGITSSSGGTGKTTVALNLSALLCSKGFFTCLVDLTVNKSVTKYHFPTSGPPATIVSWIDATDNCDRAMSELVQHGLSGMHIIAAPALLEQWELITPGLLKDVFDCLSKKYEAVIVDVALPLANQEILNLLSPVWVTTTEETVLSALQEFYKNKYTNPNTSLLVVNKCSGLKLMQGKKIISLLGVQPVCYLPDNRSLIDRAYNQRARTLPVNLSRSKGKPFIKPLEKLVSSLFNKPAAETKKPFFKRNRYKQPGSKGPAGIIIINSVGQAINEAKKAARPLVIVDANYNSPSLAIGFGIPPEKIWAHDWRAGSTVEPYKVEKGVELYILDPQIEGFDDRDNQLLNELLTTLSSNYKAVLVLRESHSR